VPPTDGARLGPYQLGAAIGAGGMGEVYRARDARLGRNVASKILPSEVADDPDRLRRFEQEARAAAALNHPNILSVYDVGTDNGVAYLVTELLEGTTLRDAMAGRGAAEATPYTRMLDYAVQIADGLAAAHARGIVHRDLKPENVFVCADGRVKILDFGLAKLVGPDAPVIDTDADADATALSPAHTGSGVILGTVGYMAPEQIRGQAVDARTDIFAFGCVLYEMLAGRRAFSGDTPLDTLSAILKDTPAPLASASPGPAIPPTLARIVERCLEKVPVARFQSTLDLVFALRSVLPHQTGDGRDDGPIGEVSLAAPNHRRERIAWAVTVIAIAALAMATWLQWGDVDRDPPAPASPLRLSADMGIGPTLSLALWLAPAVVISPDGGTVAAVAASSGRTMLHVRRPDQLQATLLAGTEGAQGPFFSPDGQWVAFFADGKLKKIAVSGGAAVTLCDAPTGRGGWWGQDAHIVFQPTGARASVLQRVHEAGGSPAVIGTLAEGETTQSWPQILPGGRTVLYSGNISTTGWDQGNIMAQPISGGPPKLILRGGFHARYIRTGHLIYVNQGTLFAVPFDPERLELKGTPAPLLEAVTTVLNTGAAHFSSSETGTLVYVPESGASEEAPVHWMDATGATTVLRAEKANWTHPRFSPNGQRLAMSAGGGSADVWIYEAAQALTKFTFDSNVDMLPVWTPDGRRLAFSSNRPKGETFNLYWQRADGTGDSQRLTESPNTQYAGSFHPNGKRLAFVEHLPATGSDIMILPIEGDATGGWKPGKPTTFLATSASETAPMFSPDGRWIAYMSTESGPMEVYVRPFEGATGQWKISTATGLFPKWSRVRNELFYVRPGAPNVIMVASYTAEGASFRADRPRQWSPGAIAMMGANPPYDLHPDGLRIAMMKPLDEITEHRNKAVFVFKFFDQVMRLSPRR